MPRKFALAQMPRQTLQFIHGAREELRKVVWPDRPTTVRYTVIVIVASIATGLIIGGMDYVLQLLLERVI